LSEVIIHSIASYRAATSVHWSTSVMVLAAKRALHLPLPPLTAESKTAQF